MTPRVEETSYVSLFLNQIKSNLSLPRLATSPIFSYCFLNVLPLPASYDSCSNPRVTRVIQLREMEVKGLWPVALPFVPLTVAALGGLELNLSQPHHSQPRQQHPRLSPSPLECCLQSGAQVQDEAPNT